METQKNLRKLTQRYLLTIIHYYNYNNLILIAFIVSYRIVLYCVVLCCNNLLTKADVLSDPRKRALYNEFGPSLGGPGSESAADGPGFPSGSGFYGGFRGHTPERGEDVSHNMNVSLEDLYNGKLIKLVINRNKVCVSCNGRGCKEGSRLMSCSTCNGRFYFHSFTVCFSSYYAYKS